METQDDADISEKAVTIMCEILFRGKRTDNGELVYGYYVHIGPVSCQRAYIIPEYASALYVIEVDPSTVGQYTGLKDMNGKRIFEGDIVEGAGYTAEDEGYGVVGFDDGAFEVSGNNCCGTFHENYWGADFEIIGNIHDNPELLEGGDNK